MAEFIEFFDYGPSQLGECVRVLEDKQAVLGVARGMASVGHDTLVDLHKSRLASDDGFDRYDDGTIAQYLAEAGWDTDSLTDRYQTQEYYENSEFGTVIESIPTGEGIDYHSDLIGDFDETVLHIPRGYGMSINLVSGCQFVVEVALRQFVLPESLTVEAIQQLTKSAEDLSDSVDKVATADIAPGDVVLWQQPQAHSVSVYDKNRRAITVIKEELSEVGCRLTKFAKL